MLGSFLILIMVISVEAQIEIQNDSLDLLNAEVVILEVGSDINLHLATETFLIHYPNPNKVKIISIGEQNEIFHWLLVLPSADFVIFGHGISEGLIHQNEVISWDTLREFVIHNVENTVYAMACYSGYPVNNYIGFPFKIDAEAAALFVVANIASERGFIIDSYKMNTISILKQKALVHPLDYAPWIVS